MDRLNVALVGCGDISGRHISAFQNCKERARIMVCCDTDIERAQSAAEKTGEDGAKAVTDFEAVFSDPSVDAVDLCLPHHLHARMTVAAAEAGKHILCEKPLALTVEECDSMISAAKAAGVVLAHGEPMRCAGLVIRAAQVISEGAIGRLVGLQAAIAYWQRAELNTGWRGRQSQSGGGHLMDGGIHIIDVLRHLGGTVSAVQAMTASFRPELGENSEDLAMVNLRYAAGHCGQLFACHATRGRGASPLITVFGEAGCLSLEAYGPGNGLVLFLPGKPPEVQSPDHSWVDGYDRLVRNFVVAVLDGEPLLSPAQEGRESVRVVHAAYRSAQTGAEVAL